MKKTRFLIFSIFFTIYFCNVYSLNIYYPLKNEKIDVIIPTVNKDITTLNLCIKAIRENCDQIRKVIVISDKPLTKNAEWFDEKNYPFTKNDIALYLLKGDTVQAQKYLKKSGRVGWYYQQLLKLYAAFVIPDLSSNILVLDADTIFLKPVTFMDNLGNGFYNVASYNYAPYFEHAQRLVPDFVKVYPQYSGICHHMLFQKPVLDDLFQLVEAFHGKDFWKAFCECVDINKISKSGASEYEIYFNFVLSRSQQAKLRKLRFANIPTLNFNDYKAKGYDYVTSHSWMRNKK